MVHQPAWVAQGLPHCWVISTVNILTEGARAGQAVRRCSRVSSSSHSGQTSSSAWPIRFLYERRRSEWPVRSLAASTLSVRVSPSLSPGVTRRGPFWAWYRVCVMFSVQLWWASRCRRDFSELMSIGTLPWLSSAASLVARGRASECPPPPCILSRGLRCSAGPRTACSAESGSARPCAATG